MMDDFKEGHVFKRVGTISGGSSVSLGFIGINTRHSIANDRCEVRSQFWFRLKTGYKAIKITKTLGWMGCEEGLAAARALAEKFEVGECELSPALAATCVGVGVGGL